MAKILNIINPIICHLIPFSPLFTLMGTLNSTEFFKCLKLPQFTNLKIRHQQFFLKLTENWLFTWKFVAIHFLKIFRFQSKNDLLWSRVKFQPIIQNEQLDIQILNSLLQYLIHTLSMTYKWPLVLIQIATSQNCRDLKKFVKMHVCL